MADNIALPKSLTQADYDRASEEIERHYPGINDDGTYGGYIPKCARRQPEPPPGLDEWEAHVMAADCPAVCMMARANVSALLRYVRRLERDVAEGSFW